MAGAFLVSDFGLLVMMLRAFSRDLPCCSDRTDFLFLGSWEGPRGSAGMLWARCGAGWIWRGGRVDSMQCQGIAQPRRLGAARVPCQGIAWVRHRDVAPLPC